jgi:hypothetical protein
MLRELTPYDHLRRFYRLCTVHFKRKIHEIRTAIETPEALDAMYSLVSSQPLPDFSRTMKIIESGGPKARGMIVEN